jgi:hypothetical protein
MYWLCYDHDDPRHALILYAAVAPDEYDNVYGYESRQEANDALNAALEAFYEWGE